MEKRGQNTRQRFDWKRVTEFFFCATTAAPMCSGANSRPSFRVAFAEFFFIVSSSSSSSFSWKSTRPGGTVTKPSLKKKEQKWNTVCVCYQVAMMKYSSALPHLGVAFLCDLMARSCNCGPPPPPPGQTDSLHSSENVFFFQTTFLFALHLLFYRQQQPQQQQQQPKKKSLSLGVSIGFEVASSLK